MRHTDILSRFAVPNDPSRGAWAPVPIPGLLRLALELGFFALAALALSDLGFHKLTALFAAVVGAGELARGIVVRS